MRYIKYRNLSALAHPCFRENLWKTEMLHSFGDKVTSLIRPARLVLVEVWTEMDLQMDRLPDIPRIDFNKHTAVMLGSRYTHNHSLPPETWVDASQIITNFGKHNMLSFFSWNVCQLVDMQTHIWYNVHVPSTKFIRGKGN